MSRPNAQEGGVEEVLATERASASWVAPVVASRRSGAQVTAAELDLPALQAWFMDVIADPGTVESGLRRARARHGVAPGAVLTPGPDLDVADRIRIYHYAYRARLQECLADDFPAVKAAMGDAAFTRLCDAVITRFPSEGPNLNRYGQVLRDHLRDGARVRGRAFLADLATLEWALVEAVHAAPPPALDLGRLQSFTPDQWSAARFRPNPALRVLGFDFPVNAWLQRWRQGGAPPIPRRRATATAVYRRGYVVWRMDLTPVTRGLLDRLCAGVPLAEALAPIEGQAGEGQVMEWCSAWVSGGFFADVQVD